MNDYFVMTPNFGRPVPRWWLEARNRASKCWVKHRFADAPEQEKQQWVKAVFAKMCLDGKVPHHVANGQGGTWHEYQPAWEQATNEWDSAWTAHKALRLGVLRKPS